MLKRAGEKAPGAFCEGKNGDGINESGTLSGRLHCMAETELC